MEADEPSGYFRLPQTPFEVDQLSEQIFGELGYADLQNCCLVSTTWNVTASKLLQKLRDACRRVQCRIILSAEEFCLALADKKQLFVMENDQQLFDLLRTRNLPSGHGTLPPFRFDYETPNFNTNFPNDFLHLIDTYSGIFSASYDKTIAAFLTNTLLSDFVGSVTLNRRFADLEAVLAILTKLPNLKELKLKFEPNICREIQKGGNVPQCEATSTVQKLELELVFDSSTNFLSECEMQQYICAILQVCIDLKSFKFVDNFCNSNRNRRSWKRFDININHLVNAIKLSGFLEELEIQGYEIRTVPKFTKIHPFTPFPNLKSLDLLGWGRLSLTDWNNVVAEGFATNLQVLCVRLHHTECPRQLVYFHSMAPGMNASGSLKHLVLSLTWERLEADAYDWYEEWNVVQEGGALTLTEARIVYDDTAVVDLRHFQHLEHLTLRVRKETLAAALAAAPSAVKHLQLTAANSDFILMLTDEELKSAVAEHFAAAATLDVLHVRQFWHYFYCKQWIKCVYLNKQKKSHHVRELGLRIIGSGSTKRLTGFVSEETAVPSGYYGRWVSESYEIVK